MSTALLRIVALGIIGLLSTGCEALRSPSGTRASGSNFFTTNYLSREEALASVFPETTRVVPHTLRLSDPERAKAAELLQQPLRQAEFDSFVGVKKDGSLDGFAFIQNEIGKFKYFTFIVGVEPDGSVRHVAVLVYREARGDGIAKRRYLVQYPGKTVKHPFSKNKDIINIQGATMSVDSLNHGIKKVLAVTESAYLANPERIKSLIASKNATSPTTTKAAEDRIISANELVEEHESRLIMGSLCDIRAWGSDRENLRRAFEAAFDSIEACDRALSDYKVDSDISRLNRADVNQAVHVSPLTADFLATSHSLSSQTYGAFDLTTGAITSAWQLRGQGRHASEEELSSVAKVVGSDLISCEGDVARVLRSGVILDPGAIGKGYAVDRAVAALKAHGIENALVDFGSTTFALGSPPRSKGWRVAIRDPLLGDRVLNELILRDEALSVSGSRGKTIRIGERTVGHIVSPFTYKPLQELAGAIVRAPNATTADAFSTACYVLGEDSVRLFESQPGLRIRVFRAKDANTDRQTWNSETPVLTHSSETARTEDFEL